MCSGRGLLQNRWALAKAIAEVAKGQTPLNSMKEVQCAPEGGAKIRRRQAWSDGLPSAGLHEKYC